MAEILKAHSTAGMKSSELKVLTLTAVVMLLNGTQYIDIPWDMVKWMFAGSGVYTLGRSFAKMDFSTQISETINAPRGEAP